MQAITISELVAARIAAKRDNTQRLIVGPDCALPEHPEVFVIGDMARDVIKRPFVAVGFAAFVLLIPLAATSMDYAVRALGTWWKPVQRWTYAAAGLTLFTRTGLIGATALGSVVYFACGLVWR